MQKVLICDIDDVLLDWSRSFNTFLEDQGYASLATCNNTIKECLGITEEQVKDLMLKHNTSNSFSKIKPNKDSLLLNQYYKIFSKIYFISACGDQDIIVSKRLKNLKDLFTFDFELITVQVHGSKYNKLKEITQDNTKKYYFLDDRVQNVVHAEELGCISYVYYTHWTDPKGFKTVQTIQEFLKEITK